MKPMNNEAKVVLDRYRTAESLAPEARARVVDNMMSRIAAGDWPADGLDVAPPQQAAPGIVAKTIAGPLGKIGLAVIVASLPAAWLLHAAGEGERRAATLVMPPARLAAAQASERQVAIPRASRAQPRLARSVPEPSVISSSMARHQRPSEPVMLPRVATAVRQESGQEDANHVQPQSTTLPDTIDEEVRLLSQAHASLRSGRPRDALAKLTEHEQRFPNSKLTEARQVARMIGLCDSGRSQAARAEAERFLAARPRSPLANRVRNVCVSPPVKR